MIKMTQQRFLGRDGDVLPPFQKTRTSRAAAEAIANIRPVQNGAVYDFIARQGGNGATIEEIALNLRWKGRPIKESSVCARIADLRDKLLLIRHNGQTRPTAAGNEAMVWVAIYAAPS